jgi:hypothetical protein
MYKSVTTTHLEVYAWPQQLLHQGLGTAHNGLILLHVTEAATAAAAAAAAAVAAARVKG